MTLATTITMSCADRRQHNLDLALYLARKLAILPCLNKDPLAVRHTLRDTDIDRAQVIAKLKADKGDNFRMPLQIGSTQNAESIQRWSNERPDFVPAIPGGAGNKLYIVDCDTPRKQNDADGVSYFEALAAQHGFDLTQIPCTHTQSGGRHYYFSNPRGFGCGARGFADKNIQIKAEGGYVVAPGAVRADGKHYQPAPGHPSLFDAIDAPDFWLPEVPQWLTEAAGSRALQDGVFKDAPLNYQPDDPSIAKHALHKIELRYPDMIPTGTRHDTVRDAANIAMDCGLEIEEASALIFDWMIERCDDPLPAEEIEALTYRSRNSRQDAVGREYVQGWSLEGHIGPVVDEDEAPPPKTTLPLIATDASGAPTSFGCGSFRLLPRAQTKRIAQEELKLPQLIDGYMPRGSLWLIYGPTSTGKSFFSIDIAMHVATGAPWCEMEVEHGAVTYFAGEDPSTIYERLTAWENAHGIEIDLPVAVSTGVVELASNPGKVIAGLKAYAASTGLPLKLVIVDTWASVLNGDESSSKDVKPLLDAAWQIIAETGATVLVNHHVGKDSDRGARGWSGVPSNMRITCEIRQDADGIVVETIKRRVCGPKLIFKVDLADVVIGKDGKGRDVECGFATCRLATESEKRSAARGKGEKALGENPKKILKRLQELTDAAALADDRTLFPLKEVCDAAGVTHRNSRRTAIEKLTLAGLIRESDGMVELVPT